MDDVTISATILFGGGIVAAIVGYYFVDRLAKKEEKEKAQSVKGK